MNNFTGNAMAKDKDSDSDKLAQIYGSCVEQLHDFVREAGFEEVVIGLSGGIDSSLTTVMAVDALGASAVLGVMLPGPYSSEHSLKDAEDLASNLGIASKVISITEPYEAFARVYAKATGVALGGIAAENTQARCRMVVLMALSNARGQMMLNTGNKSEACMGYSTLYGDTAGAFAPLGGLYKTQVYALAKWRNAARCAGAWRSGARCAGAWRNSAEGETFRSGAEGEAFRSGAEGASTFPASPIPENVLVKAPSAELSPNQSDEASMGIDYDTLDRILVELVDKKLSVDEIVAQGFARTQVSSIAKRYKSYAFKRALEPPYPKI